MKNFFRKYKKWYFFAAAFLGVRILIFWSFWQASQSRGGWNNFYDWAQPARLVFLRIFHEYCDWHPPLFYAFTSSALATINSLWFIYILDLLLVFAASVFVYKIARLFFSERISFAAALLISLEPFWAWQNMLLASENLFLPLLLAGFYYFFKFAKFGGRREIIFSAFFLGLASLTRLNSLLFAPIFSVLLFIIFLLKNYLKFDFLPKLSFKRLLADLIIFNLAFVLVLAPWMVRNKIVYGRLALSNLTASNYYFYNLPPLIAWQEKVSEARSQEVVRQKAYLALGENVGDQGNCKKFPKEQFSAQLN
ncbi:MAG: glycosyltransferase family 39 protein, partial [Candidatus Portnoybacteria bacterium]|nr:glycosyltransferase family 39 protein [Candidatus Portnoybacteria bacterium]